VWTPAQPSCSTEVSGCGPKGKGHQQDGATLAEGWLYMVCREPEGGIKPKRREPGDQPQLLTTYLTALRVADLRRMFVETSRPRDMLS